MTTIPDFLRGLEYYRIADEVQHPELTDTVVSLNKPASAAGGRRNSMPCIVTPAQRK